MALIAENFIIQELVCQDVYNKFREKAWQFFDPRLIITLDWIRNRMNKPIYVNNWDIGGKFDERGLRCNLCSLVKNATDKDMLYMTSHLRAQAADFDIPGMVAEEIRRWLIARKNFLPYPIRVEDDVSWCHLDVQDTGEKLYIFKP